MGILLKGVFTLAPIGLTIFIIYKIYQITDGLFKGLLQRVGFYFPGLGVLITLGIIFAAGLLASHWFTNRLLSGLDRIMSKIPLIGNIFAIIKDTVHSFSGNKSLNRLVTVSLPGGLKVLGFLTNDRESVFIPKGYVGVYLMQSMQWAGNLILVPVEMVQPVNVSSEEALKFIASAGLLQKE